MNARPICLAGLLCAGLSASAPAAILVTEVMSSSSHPSGSNVNNDDWFELTNTGPSAVSLVGWSWDDNTTTAGSANFGSLTSIGAGQSVIITGEALGAEAAWLASWGISGVTVVNLGGGAFQSFSSGGDQVNIYDATNTLVTSVTFLTATAGASFEWSTTGASLGVSVAGENGAFVSSTNGAAGSLPGSGTDIGSPGVAVPEPATTAFGLLALVGLVRRRR